MKKISFVVPKYLQKNSIFDEQAHRDQIVDCFVKLKKDFKNLGYDLSTNDINTINESDIVIYNNMPKKLPNKKDIAKSFVILFESSFIRPDNFDINKHKNFNKIFTWHDEYIDEKRYFKINYSHKFPKTIKKINLKQKKLCVLINSNKVPNYINQNDLYSKRVETIRWFEANHPDEFDLYGFGWDKFRFGGSKFFKALNLVPYLCDFLSLLLVKKFTSYKGVVRNKKLTLEKYSFSICYENIKNISGYITEKIFDSFFAGCVPIYWGANNVLDYIPKDCFIDRRDFKTHDDLYQYIKNISEKEYLNYLKNIENYLNNDLSLQFKSEKFTKTIVEKILLKKVGP
jgi:alpha(1,3/1,4) fucosyltransferase